MSQVVEASASVSRPVSQAIEPSAVIRASSLANIDVGKCRTALEQSPSFVRVCEMFCRAFDSTNGVGQSTKEIAIRERLVEAFKPYCQAWMLHLTGMSTETISGQIEVRGVREWIERGGVPLAISRRDPEYRSKRTVQAQIPEQPSPAFAFVLGALSGSLFEGRGDQGIMLHHRNREPSRDRW